MSHESRMSERRNELLTDMMALAEQTLTEHGVGSNESVLIASALADRLADHWGGQNITFPKDFKWKLARLELEIYDFYRGANLGDTALKYDITERGLRKLIARARKRIVANSKQRDIFDTPGAA